MVSQARAYSEKTIVTNYLIAHYVKGDVDPLSRRQKRVIRVAVDEIFSLHYFHKLPSSCEWYEDKIIEILTDMEQKLMDVYVKS